MRVFHSKRASNLSLSCLLKSFGTSGPASDFSAPPMMVPRSTPPRIFAPWKKSSALNWFFIIPSSASSICAGSLGLAGGLAATGPMIREMP